MTAPVAAVDASWSRRRRSEDNAMSVQRIVEPTPEQLATINTLEARVRKVFLEVVSVSEEIVALKLAGLETREAAEAVAGVDNDALDELRTLRISRGIQAFSD